MKPALIILAIVTALSLAALNASAVITGILAVATGPLFDRESAWVGWLILLLLITAVVVVIAARKGHRLADDDGEIWRQIDNQH